MRRFILIFIIHACASGVLCAQSLSEFLAAARGGDAVAQYNAAQCYRYGWGTEADTVASRRFLRLATEASLAPAVDDFISRTAHYAPDLAAYLRGAQSTIPYSTSYRSYDDGCYYGEIFGGTRDGYGFYLWDDGSFYRGCWEDGVRYGVGITRFDDLLIFGNHTGDVHGFGAAIITTPNRYFAGTPGAVRYVGNFEGGIPSGMGTLYDAEGALVYYGLFTHGAASSPQTPDWRYDSYRWVREELPNGDVWEGEMLSGSREGFGIYLWSDGSWWFGFWQNGLREGSGLYIRNDGAMMVGVWESGELKVEN